MTKESGDIDQERIESTKYFVEHAEAEGLSWKQALSGFDELKKI